MDTDTTQEMTSTPEENPEVTPNSDIGTSNVAPPAEDIQENVAPLPEEAPVSNPFDFTKTPDEPSVEQNEETPEDEQPYTLDLGDDYDGDDATRDMLTANAKASGLEPSAASAFIKAVAADLLRNQNAVVAEQNAALQSEWGADYEANMKATGAYMRDRMQAAGIPASEAAVLMNATVFRLMNYERMRGNESPARGTQTTPPMTKQQAYDAFTHDPANRSILFDPSHPQYAEVAAKANALHPLGMQMY